jgi:acetyl esterase/lipase
MKKILSEASMLVTLAGACMALAGCSPLVVLNAVAPGKGFSRQADVAYGPLSRQKLDVYVPDAAVAVPFPVVVFFYGGGWESGQRKDYRFVGAELATRGVMTIVADYRVYPEVVFPAFVEDGALAVKWALDHAA